MPKVKEALASVDSAAVASALETAATYVLDVDGTTVDWVPTTSRCGRVAHEAAC